MLCFGVVIPAAQLSVALTVCVDVCARTDLRLNNKWKKSRYLHILSTADHDQMQDDHVKPHPTRHTW